MFVFRLILKAENRCFNYYNHVEFFSLKIQTKYWYSSFHVSPVSQSLCYSRKNIYIINHIDSLSYTPSLPSNISVCLIFIHYFLEKFCFRNFLFTLVLIITRPSRKDPFTLDSLLKSMISFISYSSSIVVYFVLCEYIPTQPSPKWNMGGTFSDLLSFSQMALIYFTIPVDL